MMDVKKIYTVKRDRKFKISILLDWIFSMLIYGALFMLISKIFKHTIYLDYSFYGLWSFLLAITIYVLNKVIKPIGLRSLFLEKYIIFEEKEKWSAYSLEEEKVVLEKSFTKENGFLNILPGKIHTYFYTSYAWDYEEPVEIYNEKLELISENYVPRGKTKEENLIVTKEKEPFITGGISSKSYYRVKDFNMIDSNGLEIYQSKKYLSIQNFVENEEQETEYFLGVDEENILNLYDMKEKLLAKIIEWDENKRLCTTGNMENDIYKFAVSLTSDTSMFYEYNTKTNTLKKEYKEEGVCTK